MKLANKLLEQISYEKIVASLVDVMAANFEEFVVEHANFKETIALLEKQLGEESSPSVSEELNAINQQIGACLAFSCFLGLKANWDHYIDPVGRTFIDVDPEIYLRENVVRQLPDYQNAQRVQKQFHCSLSPEQQELYENISAYISHLETVGPKLAHYYGYVLGNQLLPHVMPGFVADSQLTLQYRCILENYLGVCTENILFE